MEQSQEIEQLLSSLASAPARFASTLSRLEDADSVTSGEPEEWSAREVLAHVRASNDILEHRILQVLVRENTILPSYDERIWAEVAHYATLPVAESLETMRLRRKELVRALRGIAPADWERSGMHEVRGKMTLVDIAEYIVNHEEEHLAQIERSVGSRGSA